MSLTILYNGRIYVGILQKSEAIALPLLLFLFFFLITVRLQNASASYGVPTLFGQNWRIIIKRRQNSEFISARYLIDVPLDRKKSRGPWDALRRAAERRRR